MSTPWEKPPRTLALGSGELHIWRAALDLDTDQLDLLGASLSSDERDRAARFVFPRDRTRFVAARGILRSILGAYLSMPSSDLRFAYNRYGKPVLDDPPSARRLNFNLAHSGNLGLYALAWDHRVGVDVEQVRHQLDYLLLLPGIFSTREQATLTALPASKRRPAFFNTWACKEAVLKARGDGLALPPDQVEAGLLPETQHWSVDPDGQAWRIYNLEADPDYAVAVAVEGQALALSLYAWRFC